MRILLFILSIFVLISCEEKESGWGYVYKHLWESEKIDSIYFEPGIKYYYISNKGNPFEDLKYTECKIVSVKDGYVKFKATPSWGKKYWYVRHIEIWEVNRLASFVYNRSEKHFITSYK